jgi:hypothetical protein
VRGPVERDTVARVARLVLVDEPVAVEIARAAVVLARALDDDPGVWVRYCGRGRDVLAKLLYELGQSFDTDGARCMRDLITRRARQAILAGRFVDDTTMQRMLAEQACYSSAGPGAAHSCGGAP